jgi:hypothetical protein
VQKTHWRCPLARHQLLSCTHLGRSCPPWGTRQKTRPVRCMPRRCFSANARLSRSAVHLHEACAHRENSRIAGNLPPETPTMESFPTFPRLRRSNRVKPTTPTFLSDLEAPPPTNPVVYSPVPTWRANQCWPAIELSFEYARRADACKTLHTWLLVACKQKKKGNRRECVQQDTALVRGRHTMRTSGGAMMI